MSQQVYSALGRGTTQSRSYTNIDQPPRELPSLANNLALVCPRNTRFAVECYTSWTFSDIDNDPLSHDPTKGFFISLDDAFQALADCRNMVLDKFKLPKDDCKLIASAIENRTVVTVYDGSFDPNDWL